MKKKIFAFLGMSILLTLFLAGCTNDLGSGQVAAGNSPFSGTGEFLGPAHIEVTKVDVNNIKAEINGISVAATPITLPWDASFTAWAYEPGEEALKALLGNPKAPLVIDRDSISVRISFMSAGVAYTDFPKYEDGDNNGKYIPGTYSVKAIITWTYTYLNLANFGTTNTAIWRSDEFKVTVTQ